MNHRQLKLDAENLESLLTQGLVTKSQYLDAVCKLIDSQSAYIDELVRQRIIARATPSFLSGPMEDYIESELAKGN